MGQPIGTAIADLTLGGRVVTSNERFPSSSDRTVP